MKKVITHKYICKGCGFPCILEFNSLTKFWMKPTSCNVDGKLVIWRKVKPKKKKEAKHG